jgi:hypothetical protein
LRDSGGARRWICGLAPEESPCEQPGAANCGQDESTGLRHGRGFHGDGSAVDGGNGQWNAIVVVKECAGIRVKKSNAELFTYCLRFTAWAQQVPQIETGEQQGSADQRYATAYRRCGVATFQF